MLPKFETPTFKVSLKSSKKEYKCRPFLVKEEKLLTMASASDNYQEMISCCQQVCQNCLLDELDVESLTMFDLQWLFLQIKAKSVGETHPFTLICGNCDATSPWEVNFNEFVLNRDDVEYEKKIAVNEEAGLILRYPTSTLVSKIEETDDLDIIRACIEKVYTADEVIDFAEIKDEEAVEFIESLPIPALRDIREYFETMPYLEKTIDFTCPKCKEDNQVYINGYEHFFG